MDSITGMPWLQAGFHHPTLSRHTLSDLSKPDSDTPAGDDIVWGQNAYQITRVFKYELQKNSEQTCNWTNNSITPNYVWDQPNPLPFTKNFKKSWNN